MILDAHHSARNRDLIFLVETSGGNHLALAATEVEVIGSDCPCPAVRVAVGKEEEEPFRFDVRACPKDATQDLRSKVCESLEDPVGGLELGLGLHFGKEFQSRSLTRPTCAGTDAKLTATSGTR